MRRKDPMYLVFFTCFISSLVMAMENPSHVAPEDRREAEALDAGLTVQPTEAPKDGTFLTKLFWAGAFLMVIRLIDKHTTTLLDPRKSTREICTKCRQKTPGVCLFHTCKLIPGISSFYPNETGACTVTKLPDGSIVPFYGFSDKVSCEEKQGYVEKTSTCITQVIKATRFLAR